MRDLPGPIKDFIVALTDDTLSPAYMLINHEHGLVDWGGDLDDYGISKLKRGMDVGEHVSFMTGVLPLATKSLFLPNIHAKDHVFANVYVFSREEGTWVLMLDTTGDVAKRKVAQQKLYESQLAANQLVRENESLYEVNAILEELVRERTAELSQTILQLKSELAKRDTDKP